MPAENRIICVAREQRKVSTCSRLQLFYSSSLWQVGWMNNWIQWEMLIS